MNFENSVIKEEVLRNMINEEILKKGNTESILMREIARNQELKQNLENFRMQSRSLENSKYWQLTAILRKYCFLFKNYMNKLRAKNIYLKKLIYVPPKDKYLVEFISKLEKEIKSTNVRVS